MFNAMSGLTKFLICCLIVCGGASESNGQELLAPPFGLHWGDTPDKILDWAADKKLNVTVKIPGASPELRIIRVESASGPLPQHQAYALETRYHHGKLFEVTVHYGAPGIDPKRMEAHFNKVKSALTLKHGILSPNNKQNKKEGGYIRKSVSYHVEPAKGLMLLLVLSQLEDTVRDKHSARFSLIYRNQNIIPK